jgi:hypothetical protein
LIKGQKSKDQRTNKILSFDDKLLFCRRRSTTWFVKAVILAAGNFTIAIAFTMKKKLDKKNQDPSLKPKLILNINPSIH